ncbi:MAG: condensation domain-containing protein, partial [Bradymonadaceae bacterium]
MSDSCVEDVLPLSPLQRGLLVESLARPDAGVYLIQYAIIFDQALETEELRRAWELVIERHPILRTEFYWRGLAEPVQVVRSRADVPLEVHDWRETSGSVDEAFATLMDRRRREGLDLRSAPLMNLDLLYLPDGRCRLAMTNHHLIEDAWSVQVVGREFLELLDEIHRGGEPSVEPVPYEYRDHIEWVTDQSRREAEQFWSEQLADVEPTRLPVRDRTTSESEQAYGELRWEIADQTARQVEALAQRLHVSTNTVFQGAFAVLLSRYARDREVTYGLVMSGRSGQLEAVDRRVGMFVNTVPMCIGVEPDRPLADWLRHLHDKQTQIRDYKHCSLTDIQQWAGHSSEQPLFEGIFGFQNLPSGIDEADFETLSISEMRGRERPHNPLSIQVRPQGGRVEISAYFEVSRLQREDVGTLLEGYEQLLRSFGESSARPLADHRLMEADEADKILGDWGSGS